MSFPQRTKRLGPKLRGAAEQSFHRLDERLPAASAGKLLRKAFPDHWAFLLGELALYSLMVLVLTGVFLAFFFDPAMTEITYHGSYAPLHGTRMTQAYASTLDISFDVRGGLLIRQVHHWAALTFLASIGVHMLRIFFTGAFRRPREGNWTIGVTLFLLALLEGSADTPCRTICSPVPACAPRTPSSRPSPSWEPISRSSPSAESSPGRTSSPASTHSIFFSSPASSSDFSRSTSFLWCISNTRSGAARGEGTRT